MKGQRRRFLRFAAGSIGAFAIAPKISFARPTLEQHTMTLQNLSRRMINREVTSRELIEQALAAIAAPDGEGARAFLQVHRDAAVHAADRVDAERRSRACARRAPSSSAART
jgi:aspartyl-tRNA(Asn)/glutamyl-tRNA(Gln) amidotransferase subunit A